MKTPEKREIHIDFFSTFSVVEGKHNMSYYKTETQQEQDLADRAGEFTIGNDLRVTRLGFGAMRITGEGIWGQPADRAEAVKVLQRTVELGINFIVTLQKNEGNCEPYVSICAYMLV